MAVDKNKATINFISSYPEINTSPLFVNFMNGADNDFQFMTDSNDSALNKPFVDGSVLKRYIFSIVVTKAITDDAIAKDILENENVTDIAEIQAFMDWINAQGELNIFPDFGEDCVIEEMHTTAENPDMTGINVEVSPALAIYCVEIRIDYIDYSKVIWS